MQNQSHQNITPRNEIFLSEGISIFPELGEIIFDSKKIRISPNNMRVLKVLLVNSQQVVSRKKIFDSVWKNQIISEDTLTRCISDLRSAFKSVDSNKKLIETIPKLGYRWIARATKENIEWNDEKIENDIDNEFTSTKLKIKKPDKNSSLSNWWLVTFALLFITLVTSVWQTSKVFDRQIIRIALMPMQNDAVSQERIKRTIELAIKDSLLKTDRIRFLSSQAINSNRLDLYPYLAREYAIEWIIEGNISSEGKNTKITINLVDARTALVEYSFSSISSKENTQELEQSTIDLIFEIKRNLLPN
ncbi:MAG: hypothetical protein COA86_08845 [Kangiella sp.]|nr:MAG: hypothetical protein COA86_08845 [Kangiella sp.]